MMLEDGANPCDLQRPGLSSSVWLFCGGCLSLGLSAMVTF